MHYVNERPYKDRRTRGCVGVCVCNFGMPHSALVPQDGTKEFIASMLLDFMTTRPLSSRSAILSAKHKL